MGEVWPTDHITELCLQLTAGSKGDEHQDLGSQNCETATLTTHDFTFTHRSPTAVTDVRITKCNSNNMLQQNAPGR